jgi:2-hydroxy-6-oxonona-2,4-dienedioate hydrolase/2-succinyl-6-hydroxy-2,4-cyclohexadiene-1-carboxylate synthase
MPHAVAGDIRLFYQLVGPSAAPDVALIHGITGNMAVWMLSGLMHKLARQFRVTAYDMRGHGHSDTPPTGYTSADMSDDFARLHETLCLRPVLLLGHSFGGAVALHVAQRYPELVRGVVLSDPFVPALHHLQADPRQWKGFDEYKRNAATAGMEIDGDLWDLKEMLAQAATLPDQRREMFVDRAGEAALERLIRLYPTTCGADVARPAGLTLERIAEIESPVVILYGEHSPFLPMIEALAGALPNCAMDVLPHAQHFGFEENPTEFIDRIEGHFCRMTGLEPTAPTRPLEQARRNVMTDSENV